VAAGEPLSAAFFRDLVAGTGHAMKRMIERLVTQTDVNREIALLDTLVRSAEDRIARRAVGTLGRLGPPARATLEALVDYFPGRKRRHWVTWTLECMAKGE
jgi:hypothetical protein